VPTTTELHACQDFASLPIDATIPSSESQNGKSRNIGGGMSHSLEREVLRSPPHAPRQLGPGQWRQCHLPGRVGHPAPNLGGGPDGLRADPMNPAAPGPCTFGTADVPGHSLGH